jgi:hypothetical protein
VQEVKERWETVKARVKQKNKQTAPMLNYYTVVGVEGTEEETVILIEAANDTFFKMLSQGDRAKHVDWALSLEFGQACRVRLLRPGEQPPVPTPAARPKSPGNNGGGQPAVAQPAAQVQLAPVEPAAAPVAEPAPTRQKTASEGTNGLKNTSPASPAQAAPPVEERPVPLARSNVVRENSNKVSAAAAQEMLEQKAKNNPVVQEIMRTFTVKNVQVNPNSK